MTCVAPTMCASSKNVFTPPQPHPNFIYINPLGAGVPGEPPAPRVYIYTCIYRICIHVDTVASLHISFLIHKRITTHPEFPPDLLLPRLDLDPTTSFRNEGIETSQECLGGGLLDTNSAGVWWKRETSKTFFFAWFAWWITAQNSWCQWNFLDVLVVINSYCRNCPNTLLYFTRRRWLQTDRLEVVVIVSI